MNKSVKSALLALFLISALLYSVQPSSGQKQATVKLRSSEVKSNKKIVQPSGQALVNHPDVAVVPRDDGKKSTAPSTAQTQTGEAQAQESPLDSCGFTLMVTGEINELWLEVSVGCILCTLPSQISHSNASVLGFSMSPNGPWTEELTVMTTLNTQGQGQSEHFFVKAETPGATIFHAENFFASSDTEFRVVPCSCPEIPIVP